MATHLGALRFAANIETPLARQQRELFRLFGDTSAMLLPPLVPIAVTDFLPSDHKLDVFRRSHYLRVSPAEPPAEPPEHPRRSVLPVVIHGFSAMQEDYRRQFCPTPVSDLSFDLPKEAPINVATGPHIHLGWDTQATSDQPPTPPLLLPETSALWLSVFEIVPGPTEGERWWESCRWYLRYSRRFTNRPAPPDQSSPDRQP
jgi:hypothetical protein